MIDITSTMSQGLIVGKAEDLPLERPLKGANAGMPPYLEVAEFVPQPPAPTPSTIDPQDPPVFLLNASPSWFGGALPDGVWQRVPIGTTGQVLTVQADGSIAWITGGGGFSNPMTTLGDLITGGGGGTPTRLAVGSNGQILTVSGGVPAWSGGVLTNPMTTQYDMIVGGVAGAPGRLAAGLTGQFLTATPTGPAWGQGVMGSLGDMMYGQSGGFTGTPHVLNIGSNGQVLTVVGASPAWQNASSGFANPMVNTGDMIYSSPGSTPVNLGIGAAGQVLTVSGGLPTWATPGAGGALPFTVLFPSGNTGGGPDATAIKNAITAMSPPNTPHGGLIFLAPGDWYVNVPAGNTGGQCINLVQNTTTTPNNGGQPVSLCGAGASTRIYPVGAGVTGVYMHRTVSYGGQFGHPAQQMTGFVRDLVIDGTNATGASVGLDYGDGWGYNFDLAVQNFSTAGAIGVRQINNLFWTEKNGPIVLRLSNNTTAMYITTALAPTGDHSSEYNTYYITQFCQANQQGVVVDGVNMGGSHMWLQGNMSLTSSSSGTPTGNVAALSIINAAGVTPADGHRWYEGTFWIKCEANPGNGSGTTYPYLMYSDGTGFVRMCSGAIYQSNLTNSNWNGAEFSFSGPIGDANLSTAWPSTTLPASPGTWQNKGPNALACVSGGTVSAISVNGAATGLTSGAFYVCAGGTITVTYTVAPTFNVVSAAEPHTYAGSY